MAPKKPKTRVHREWFRQVNETACPCGRKKVEVWSWGEYVRAKWRTVDWFCQGCFAERVQTRLATHAAGCGCSFELVGYRGVPLPAWLTLKSYPECEVA